MIEDQITIGEAKLREILEQLDRKQTECESLHLKNAKLADELADQRLRLETLTAQVTPSVESMTWEERKSLILKQLEREDFEDAHKRGQWIDVVAETDRVVQERDRELAELRELLRQQPDCVGSNQVVGAAAIAEILDSDELVQQERRQLQQLKQEWHEKMRQGEIELALERAELARKLHELESPSIVPA